MPNEDLSKHHFQKKILTYCDVRIAPVAPDWVAENIRPYLIGLITFRKTPALANNRYDWRHIYFPWPTAKEGVAHLTQAQLSMLVEGIDWRRPAWTSAPGRTG